MALSFTIAYTPTNGAEVMDTGQADYEDKREFMVPFGNLGKSLHPGADTARIARLVQLRSPTVMLRFGPPGTAPANASVINMSMAYTITADDFGPPPLLLGAATPITVSVPLGLAIPILPCEIIQMGTGQITITGAATVDSSLGLKSRTQYSPIAITYAGSVDSYVMTGDTTA